MYKPSYEITEQLLSDIVRIEVDTALADKLSMGYDTRSKQAQQTKAQNLFHIAHMLNLQITLRDAEKLAEGRKLEDDNPKYDLIANFRNILEANRSGAADNMTDLDETVLVRLNKMLLDGIKEDWEAKLRGAGDSLDGQFEDWINYRDNHIDAADVASALRDLLSWFRSEQRRLNGVIRVGILLWRLVEIAPMYAGNKYTTLALVDLLMHRMSYTNQTYYPLMHLFHQYEQDFWRTWDLSQRSHDLTPWLEKFAAALADSIHESYTAVNQLQDQQEQKSSTQPFLDLNKRQLKVLRYLQNIPTVRREDYCQMMDVSTMTAYRDLNDLVGKKLLKVEGQGRGTKYKLASR